MTTLDVLLSSAPDLRATSVRAVLSNPVPYRRREWVPVAVPHGALQPQRLTFLTDRGLHLRAVRCEDVGQHSTIYRVFAPFDGLQVLAGEFVVPSNVPPSSFRWHPWVVDAPRRLIPQMELRLRVGGQIVSYRTNEPWELFEIVFQNDCMLRFHFVSKLGSSGFLMEGWATFYDNSPIADVRVAFLWSDRRNPAHDWQIEGLFFLSGEPVVFDFAERTGMTPLPVHNGQHWITLVCGPLSFIDGSGLPLIGRMLCFPDGAQLPSGPGDAGQDDETKQDVETLEAAAHGPVLGLCGPRTWNGKLLAHKNAPRFGRPQEQVEAMADQVLDNFFSNTLRLAGQFYDLRPIGIGKTPGQTGDQEDFGAQKGWMATVAADPRWLHYALYSVTADFFRGVLHYESNGARLDPAAHPQWVTWSGRTHYHPSASPDRLGKGPPVTGYSSSVGWQGYDEEHRSQTNLAAVFALTGDPLLGYLIEHYSTTDIANVRHRLETGTGAPRATGRTLHCWANFMTVLPPQSLAYQRFAELIASMAFKTKRDWLGDRFPGPVDVVRHVTDARMGITHNGVILPAWSCWEHGLFAVGVYAAWKVTKDERLLDLVRRVCRTIVRYATFYDTVRGWTFVGTCHWPQSGVGPTGLAEGEPLQAQHYSFNSTLITAGNGGVSTWTQNAVLIFIELHEPTDPDMARAQEIAATFTPGDPDDARTAEWQACVRAVPPVPGDWRSY